VSPYDLSSFKNIYYSSTLLVTDRVFFLAIFLILFSHVRVRQEPTQKDELTVRYFLSIYVKSLPLTQMQKARVFFSENLFHVCLTGASKAGAYPSGALCDDSF